MAHEGNLRQLEIRKNELNWRVGQVCEKRSKTSAPPARQRPLAGPGCRHKVAQGCQVREREEGEQQSNFSPSV